MASPKLESLAIELKVMILKGMDASSILSLISASPTFHRVFYGYYSEILENSVMLSSGIRPEVLNDALAAASLPYPLNMNDPDKKTIMDEDAACKAVMLWKDRKFAFAPSNRLPSTPFLVGCRVPGYPAARFHLRDAVSVARLSFYIEQFIDDYATKARCDPLQDFYVYNNVPNWAHKTLRSKKRTSPLRPNKAFRLTKDELIKFQRAFFRFEFYARVHAHLETAGEFSRTKNPLIGIPPSEAEEVACAYGYLWSLQMLAFEEMDENEDTRKRYKNAQAYPVHHFTRQTFATPVYNTDILLRAPLVSGIKRVYKAITEPYEKRYKLVCGDIAKRVEVSGRHRGQMFGNDHTDFMGAVLNGDPQCFISRCCQNQWGLVIRWRTAASHTNASQAMMNTARPAESGAMSSGTTPNYSWNKWRNRQIKHKKICRKNSNTAPHREAMNIIAARRMCAWVFWDDSTLIQLDRWRMSDFKAIDIGGFLLEKDDPKSDEAVVWSHY
ncbi:hypothetical protein PG989_003247 [Apiospora arundinis]